MAEVLDITQGGTSMQRVVPDPPAPSLDPTPLVDRDDRFGKWLFSSRIADRLLFARSGSDIDEFRGWYRKTVWADYVWRGGPRLAFKAFLKTPMRVAREVLDGVRTFGEPVAAGGVSVARQFAQLWWLRMRHGTAIDTFYRYRLYEPVRRATAHRLIQGWEAARSYRLLASSALRPVAELLADKRSFTTWCEERGIACVPILREFERGSPVSNPEGDELLPHVDLFSKTAHGYGGKAAARWRFTRNGCWTRGEREFTEAALLNELAALSASDPVILQPAVSNHRALAGIGGRALATVRVMTVQEPDCEPAVLLTVFRMGAADAEMDNFSQGGMVCGVDVASGRLLQALAMDDQLRSYFHDRHPDTQAQITGVELPYWSDVLEMSLHAHRALGEYPCVGWDVAILDTGPVLLEGNWNPGVRIAQLPLPRPLGDTLYVGALNAHLRRRVSISDWAQLRRASVWEPHDGENLWKGE